MLWPKKIHTRNLITKKNSWGSETPLPPSYNFSNGPSLTRKRQILKFSRANCVRKQLTVRAWSHEPGWLALPRRLLSWYYMKRASPEPLFLCRDGKQCAWVACYPLSCFLLGSFSRLPGMCDRLENFHSGSRHHNAGIPANRAGLVVI